MLFKRKKEDVAVDPAPAGQPASPRTSETHDDLKNEKQHQGNHAPAKATATEVDYPVGVKLFLIMFSLLVTMFLVAVDRLIIATAIPQITDDFHSVTDIGWYGSAYLLTSCAFQLLFGKLYAFYNIKLVFIVSVVIFEVGSALCGAAPTSVAFIIGRAIGGIGGAGIGAGATMVMVHSIPLHRRPKYQGLFGAVFGVASIAGPLLGGAFTTEVTWRWCFYINLPLGGVALLVIFFLLKPPAQGEASKLPLVDKLKQLDFLGTSVVVPGTICLLLALQWGGVEYDWNSGRIIALLVLAGLFLVTFVTLQVLLPKTATVPPRIISQRSIAFAAFASFCLGAQAMMFTYYIPIWFQAIKGYSAVDSGIRTLPLVLSMMVFSVITGGIITRVGYYTPVMLLGTALMCVGAGLLTTLKVDSGAPQWAGYQVLYGVGMGLSFQAPNVAAQTVLEMRDISVGISIMMFMQTIGGAISNSVGQSILSNELVDRLKSIPGLAGVDLRGDGATTLVDLPEDVRGPALEAYNDSLRTVFVAGLSICCAVVIGAAGMEWKSVKKEQIAKKKAKEDAEAAAAAATAADGAVVPAAVPTVAPEGQKEKGEDGRSERDNSVTVVGEGDKEGSKGHETTGESGVKTA
ncbi:major facilitator superfamily transporter [Colletotrichum karsti]|uniref:Major facilitator superfamily transporter n=1 Tax=Colletotrichum karsti TaxID=1095194 RepID=A0A9P6I6I7_9PEZI|nr:major facilitator superfamily transporter [Colletotrichum karsti]KAF9874881.1 major facilitator superfamily transporter [Colletotrichum karsti]